MTPTFDSITIRKYKPQDWPSVWAILKPIFHAGETCYFATDISEEETHQIWIITPSHVYVACLDDGTIVGTYYIKPNFPELGAHIANGGYMVARGMEGRGIAALMCEHSQREAIANGFRAMQFNYVVSTNTRAVALWQMMGFAIIGTVPQAFRHHQHGFVDVHVMYKKLQ